MKNGAGFCGSIGAGATAIRGAVAPCGACRIPEIHRLLSGMTDLAVYPTASRFREDVSCGVRDATMGRPDEVVFPVRRIHPETGGWFHHCSPNNGAAMWNIIINLIYEQSSERYLSEAFSAEARARRRAA